MKLSEYYKNKVVLVTGASLGIGKELAHQLLMFGAKVIITGRNATRLKLVSEEFKSYNESILIHQGDVCDYSNCVQTIELIIEKFGRLDVVITNAGLSCFGDVEKMEVSVAKQIIDTNIYGSLFPAKAALQEIKKSKGSILFVSSIAGFHGLPGYSAYSLSKMAIKALAQSLSIELNKTDVFIGLAYVGFTENENDKRTLSPNGEWQKVPKRKAIFTASRKATALKLLNQIGRRKVTHTHSFIGKFTEYMIRFLPRLTFSIFNWNYR